MAYLGLLLAVVVDTAARLFAAGAAGALPSLPFVTALYIGFHARHSRQLSLAIALGIIADCFSTCPLGHFAFLYGAGAYVAFRIRRFLPPDPGLAYAVASFFCGVVVAFLALVVAVLSTRGSAAAGFGPSILVAATSALSAPFVFGLWSRSRLFRGALGGRTYYEFAA